ncbi:hypothetical protein UFOVP1166_51 [uncultured Caudovirales phage]|uniref:Uncharacterized protein n=1 Tax=uncultured Caudovirales phage TaxID=2100421 RepID=A0A6J5QUA0_9CAUD|nr:hypothetical protein UFOVP1166_51 [uncultured Caudovirales phage]
MTAEQTATHTPPVRFETELADLINRYAHNLTSDQVITVLERALDEALVIAGETEASTVRLALLATLNDGVAIQKLHYGNATGLHLALSDWAERARAAIARAEGHLHDR